MKPKNMPGRRIRRKQNIMDRINIRLRSEKDGITRARLEAERDGLLDDIAMNPAPLEIRSKKQLIGATERRRAHHRGRISR